MPQITSGTGLVSGINTSSIIDQLMSLEARPKTLLQSRITATTNRKDVFTDLASRLNSLKTFGTALNKSSAFQATTPTSSNENVLTATTANGAAVGSYQFQVARLVTTQQSISNGFADSATTPVGAGTISIEQGGGELTSQTLLSDLNGGKGVSRGLFQIRDRSNASAIIDITNALTVDDVLKKINTAIGIGVKATISGDTIKLTDVTGKTTSNLIVQDLGTTTSATDLGIVGNVAATTITGTDIQYISRDTRLDQLNDGRGVRAKGGATQDFSITTGDNSTIDVSIGTAKTVGDVIDAINTAGAGKVTASITAGANGMKIVDNTAGGTTFAVTALNGSSAPTDLGLTAAAAGSTITGNAVLSSINTVLLSSLRGGTGIPLGTISITDRSGASASVNLAGSKTVQDILDKINAAAGINITASLNASQNGISIVDGTGASGNFIIADTSGTSAAVLGVAGTYGTAVKSVDGVNMQKQWINTNTLMTSINGGKGVAHAKFKITNAAGVTTTVDLSQGNEIKISDVISEINSKGINVTASINTNGDGLLLTDTSVGAGKLTVDEVDSTTAADLNIKGVATTTTIDGSWEKQVTILGTDTLTDVQTKINALGYGVTASLINDGTASTPFRLSFTAKNPGRAGRVYIGGGTTALRATALVESQDAAVFLGDGSTSQPLLLTSSKNQLTGVIPGVTIDLHGVSSTPVSLNITRSADGVVDQVTTFTKNFNDLTSRITALTKYDSDTNTGGLLLGDNTVQQIQTTVYNMLNGVVKTGGKYKTVAGIGLTLGANAALEFNEDKFRAAYADDPDTVSKLFTMTETITTTTGPKTVNRGIAGVISDKITQLIDPVSGVVTLNNKSLDNTTRQFKDRIAQLDDLLTAKRARLERQFANMESVLAGLQSQQSAISSLSAATSTARTR